MLHPTIRESQTMNRVAIPYGMLDGITAALDAAGIEIAGVLDRPYVQLPPDGRDAVMADLDAAGVGGRRLVIEVAGDADDLRAFVLDHLPARDDSAQAAAASTPCDEAHARATIYSELIECYRDDVARGNDEAAAEERKMLRNMWAEYERTMAAAIDYSREVDDIANDLALMSLLEGTRRRLLDCGIIDPSL